MLSTASFLRRLWIYPTVYRHVLIATLRLPAMLAGSKVAWTTYDSQCLRSLRSTASVPLSAEAAELVGRLGIRRRRGCRAGRAVQARRLTTRRLLPVSNGAYFVTGKWQPPGVAVASSSSSRRRFFVTHCDTHAAT